MKRIGLLSDTHGYWDERYLKLGGSGRQTGSLPPATCRLRKHRRSEPAAAFSGNQPLHPRRLRCTHQAHRRLSRQIRPFGTFPAPGTASRPVHQRALTHPESQVRPPAEPAAHQSGCCRKIRLPPGTNAGTLLHRTRYFPKSGSDRTA